MLAGNVLDKFLSENDGLSWHFLICKEMCQLIFLLKSRECFHITQIFHLDIFKIKKFWFEHFKIPDIKYLSQFDSPSL